MTFNAMLHLMMIVVVASCALGAALTGFLRLFGSQSAEEAEPEPSDDEPQWPPTTIAARDGIAITPEEFEAAVQTAVDMLPDDLVHVPVTLSTMPSRQLVQEAGLDPDKQTLLGLYATFPEPHVTLFYTPIVRQTPSWDLRATVRNVLLHELGHAHGLSHAQLHAEGL